MLSNEAAFFVHPSFADLPICFPCCDRTPGKRTRSWFFLYCTLWPANLCITTPLCDGKDKIVLGWQAGNLSALCLHCYWQTEQRSYWDCCCFRAERQVKNIAFFTLFFFNLYLQQAININLILYKALEGQIILDFKAISRPVRHWVSCFMVVKVFLPCL